VARVTTGFVSIPPQSRSDNASKVLTQSKRLFELTFSALSGVRLMIETMPLARAQEACARMLRGDALPDGIDDGVVPTQ